jgi:hypothetical protein
MVGDTLPKTIGLLYCGCDTLLMSYPLHDKYSLGIFVFVIVRVVLTDSPLSLAFMIRRTIAIITFWIGFHLLLLKSMRVVVTIFKCFLHHHPCQLLVIMRWWWRKALLCDKIGTTKMMMVSELLYHCFIVICHHCH